MKIHTTDNEKIDLSIRYGKRDLQIYKPNGLWYGVDWQWHEWCGRENFEGIGKYDYELCIDDSKMLTIETHEQLYSLPTTKRCDVDVIDWELLKNDFKGFEMKNQYKMRMPICFHEKNSAHYMFAYSLDCDSGCIWDLSAILDYKLINRADL